MFEWRRQIPRKQFLLYTKNCKITDDTYSLPVAVLFKTESDSFSLQFCTRRQRTEYEAIFPKYITPQWQYIEDVSQRLKCRDDQLRRQGYTNIHSYIGDIIEIEFSTQTPWAGSQPVQIQLFRNIIDALQRGKIYNHKVCTYDSMDNGFICVPKNSNFRRNSQYFCNTPNGIFRLGLAIDPKTKKINPQLKLL